MMGLGAATDTAGRIIEWLMTRFVEFKAFTLFSFLFGAGIAIQAERAGGPLRTHLFLLRRFGVLLLIGLCHLFFIWNGDILTLYAVCGILLIPFTRSPAPLAAALGWFLVIGSAYVNFPVSLPGSHAIEMHAAAATTVYPEGTFAEILRFRFAETRDFVGPLLLLTLPRAAGVMLLGMAAWKAGLITAGRRPLLPIFLVSAVVGIPASLFRLGWIADVALSFAYAAAVLMWMPNFPLLAAGGRMALTNYLTESVVFCLIFYGYGFGQFGRLGVLPCTVGAIIFYLAQLVFSRWWLDHFQFGPVEWMWRSLTYGSPQEMHVRSRLL